MAFALTARQRAFFDCFGFLAFPGLLAAEADGIIAAFERVWAERGGGHHGAAHDGKRRSCIVPFADQSDRLSALLDDERIHAIAEGLLGEDFAYLGSDGNYYAGDTAWHSDGWHERHRYLKIAFYLDPLDGDSGALRVIPGSHRPGDGYAAELSAALHNCEANLGIHGRDVPAMVLASKPGDVLVFNHNTKHSSFNGAGHRRMFTLNLAQRFPDERLGELREYINHQSRFWTERLYGERMVATAGPQRLRHLAQGLANDHELAALSRQRRGEMAEPARG
jgi:ectoine hydroxylase-related dioxygenase (phytanoyl-CoA dioxygenase family)